MNPVVYALILRYEPLLRRASEDERAEPLWVLPPFEAFAKPVIGAASCADPLATAAQGDGEQRD